MKLAFVKENKKVIIKNILGGMKIKQRLEEIGLVPGRTVTVLKSGAGPVLLKIENSKIAIGFGEAMKIEVENLL